MKKQLIVIGLTALMVFAVFQLAIAKEWHPGFAGRGHQHHGPPPPNGKFWANPEIVEQLQLTERQISDLENFDFEYRGKAIAIRADLEIAHLRVNHALASDPPIEEEVMKVARTIDNLHSKMFQLDMRHQLVIRMTLLSKQWNRLQNMHPFHCGRRGASHGEKGGNSN